MPKGRPGMSLDEVTELMELKGWSEAMLAGHLHYGEAAIVRWFKRGKVPDGPATVLMRQWLAEARAQKPKREKANA